MGEDRSGRRLEDGVIPFRKDHMQIKRASARCRGSFQLVDISKLGLNSKIKKFSDSFICGKGYSPPEGGRIAFCLQSASLGMVPGLVLLMSIMLIAKAKGVCYNHFVGRRVLPVVASRFCYRRREGYAMTPYEIIMERILSIEKSCAFPFNNNSPGLLRLQTKIGWHCCKHF